EGDRRRWADPERGQPAATSAGEGAAVGEVAARAACDLRTAPCVALDLGRPLADRPAPRGEEVRAAAWLQLELEPVVDALVDGVLGRAMRQQEPARAGLGGDHPRLLRGEMAVRLVLGLEERRLAEEDVGVARDLDEPGRGAGVARVGEDPAAVLDTQAERRLAVVTDRP